MAEGVRVLTPIWGLGPAWERFGAADIAGDGDTALELLNVKLYDMPSSTATSRPPATRSRDASSPPAAGMPILMLTAADRLDDKSLRV